MQFVALSSSNGTTLEAVLQAIADGSLTMECKGLITDRDDRGCIEKAKRFNVPVKIVTMEKGEEREAYDQRLDDAIGDVLAGSDRSQTVIAALGWMWLFSPWFINQWKNRIINVHPSLLPKYPGTHSHQDVLANHDTESGMSIHIVDEGVDTGKILLQKSCEVKVNDTVDTLKARVQALEKEWYPKLLQMIEHGDITL